MSKIVVAVLASIVFCGIVSVTNSMGFNIGYTAPVAVGVLVGLVVG